MQTGKRRQSIYFRVVASLTAVAVLSLGTIFCFFYPLVIEAAYKRIDERRNSAMAQTVQAMDKIFGQLSKIAALVEKDASLRPYMLKGNDTMALYEARRRIENYNSTQLNDYAMFYHVNDSPYVIGSNGVMDMDSFGESIWILEHTDQDALRDVLYMTGQRRHFMLPVDRIRQQETHSAVEVLPFVIGISSGASPYASLLVLLKAKDIATELKRSWENETLFITDGEQILFSTDAAQTDKLDARQLVGTVRNVRLEAGSSLYLVPSALYGFSYGAICRPDSLYEELKALRSTAALFLFVSCMIALFASLFISRWNYQPVRQLCDSVGVELTAKGLDSELLRERFSALLSVNAVLADNMKQAQSLLEDAIVQRFLVSASAERTALIERGMKAGLFSSPCICTVAVALPVMTLSDAVGIPPESKTAGMRIFRLHQALSGGYDTLFILHEEAVSQEETERLLHEHAAGGSVCYARVQGEWRDVPDVYALLLERLYALRHLDEGAIVSMDDPRIAVGTSGSFGAEALDELADSLSMQEEESLRLAIFHLCGCINEVDRPLHERRALLFEALCMLAEALQGQGGLNAQTLEMLNPLAQGRLEDEKRMESLLRSAAEAIMAGLPKVQKQRKLPQVVLLYIDEHLLDSSFSIYTISETFGLSESAFSHLFKRTFHQTFSTYVNQQKLVYAFELLTDEDIPLEAVASRLGYSRASNFGRMFKAETGMSPGKYRSLYGRKQDGD